MDLQKCKAYEVLEQRKVTDLNSEGALLVHKKSGAKVVLLSNDDTNKVFYIGFRTTPTDSTGVAHIMEHSVLCGSRKFPVKDPFVELVKGSLNTFLNAMTYPDKTVYPVASCNDKDFQNLMDVYLDAVFYPNIYNGPETFKQEGWHYELEDKDAELKINGVVYNEMKGAFSSPDDVLDRGILNSLYPDTTYSVESGGDPDVIPELTYANYIEFHKKYYHPSNSYIYLYGNMDMVEKLEWLDKEYLSDFDAIDVDSEVKVQKGFDAPIDVLKEYSITENDKEENNTYLSYNVSIGNALDREKYIAFQVLDYAICSAPGAPLRKALQDAKIGVEIYSNYDNGIYQPYFSIVAKKSDLDKKEEFIKIINRELEKLVKDGIPKKSLQAALNYFEFRYREADYGTYPKGLIIGLNMLDSWNYDVNSPFMHIEASETFKLLKDRIGSDYYEKLIKTYLLENTHKTYVCVIPKKGLNTIKEAELTERLKAYKETLSSEEIETLIKDTAYLKEYQDSEDSPEDIAKIPMLTRADLKKEANPFNNKVIDTEDVRIVHHDIFTNGVSYVRFIFDITSVTNEDLFTLGILKTALGLMDTKKHSYGDFFNEIFLKTGSIVPSVCSTGNAKDPNKYKITLECRMKTLYGTVEDAFDLMKEMLLDTDFSDKKRLKEILEESKSKMEARLMSAGHSVAEAYTAAKFDPVAYIDEEIGGIAYNRKLADFIEHFDEKADDMINRLNEMISYAVRKDNLLVSYTGTEEGLLEVKTNLPKVLSSLNDQKEERGRIQFTEKKEKVGFKTSGAVQYVCRCGDYKKAGLTYTGALRVLRVMMGYEYLWLNVRVKGGAYGCMSGFRKAGEAYFVSYRDPNLRETIDVYENAVEWIKNYQADENTMTKYIIGAISEKDTPLTPYLAGVRSISAYMAEMDFEEEQKERDELLATTVEDIRKLSEHVKAFLDCDYLTVIGAEEKLEQNKELFDRVEDLLG